MYVSSAALLLQVSMADDCVNEVIRACNMGALDYFSPKLQQCLEI